MGYRAAPFSRISRVLESPSYLMIGEYAEHSARLDAVVRKAHSYPKARFHGRGIVVCAGGDKFLPGAWVLVNLLRRFGCALPIEMWHLKDEVGPVWGELMEPFGVSLVDASVVRQTHPARILNGWELKPYAMIHSRFAEVLLLDADNVPTADPTYLFDTPTYQATGAIFWPDRDRLRRDREFWEICKVAFRDEPEFESGQMVIDKRRCWKALQVTMHFNEWSDFYYHLWHGDKETFHVAWLKVGQSFGLAPPNRDMDWDALYQHDFDGQRIFQHRSGRKFTLGQNVHIADFFFEDECIALLAELASKLGEDDQATKSSEARALEQRILNRRWFVYCRIGRDYRPVEFLTGGRIGKGAAALERSWTVVDEDGEPRVQILGRSELIMSLREDEESGVMHGAWLQFEKCPVVFVPTGAVDDAEPR
jgi:hypothetical protein